MDKVAKIFQLNIMGKLALFFIDSDLSLYVHAPYIVIEELRPFVSQLSLSIIEEYTEDYYYENFGKAQTIQDVLVENGLATYNQVILMREDAFFENYVGKTTFGNFVLFQFKTIED